MGPLLFMPLVLIGDRKRAPYRGPFLFDTTIPKIIILGIVMH